MDRYLTIAVSKGYLLEESLPYLEKAGFTFKKSPLDGRKLYTIDDSDTLKLLMVRPWDVPTYVEQGAADLGIAGYDVLHEKQDQVLRLFDLKFGACQLVIAGPKAIQPSEFTHNLVVATKYPRSAMEYFHKKGLKTKILKLYGAIELAPHTGLSDVICDLTASGKTLAENHLHVIDTVFKSTANLIANPVSMTMKHPQIKAFIEALEKGNL